MNEYVSTAHPDWAADARSHARQARNAPVLDLTKPAVQGPTPAQLIEHAASRGRVALHDGRIVTLIGVGGYGSGSRRVYTTAHVLDDRYRHHHITPAQISHLIGTPA